jgi:hypothetical protein
MDDDSSGARRRPRPCRAGLGRAGILAATVAGIALLAAACGGESSASSAATAGTTAYQKAVAYAQCMRSHGAPSWPDPNGQGVFISTKANRADFRAPASANNSCQHLLPNGGQLTQAQKQQIMREALKYSACMRSHGITKFPDPGSRGGFNLGVIKNLGIDINSPQVKSAQQACHQFLAGGGHEHRSS